MHELRLNGTVGPILRDLLMQLAEASSPRWKGAPASFLQVRTDGNDVVLLVDSLRVFKDMHRRYTEDKGAAEGRVFSVNGVTVSREVQ